MHLGSRIETSELSKVAALSALFVVASVIPISSFIGGAGFISLSLIFVPVMAYLFKPKAAALSALVGCAVVYVLQIGIGPIFGPVSLLIPPAGAVLGSVSFRSRVGTLASCVYVLLGGAIYTVMSGGTMLWLVPYLAVLASLPLVVYSTRWRILALCFYSTMCELSTMTLASITILKLPSTLWLIICPFMFYERTVATVGSFLLISGLRKGMPHLR